MDLEPTGDGLGWVVAPEQVHQAVDGHRTSSGQGQRSDEGATLAAAEVDPFVAPPHLGDPQHAHLHPVEDRSTRARGSRTGPDVSPPRRDRALTRSPHRLHHSCPRRLLASERRVHRVVEAAVIEVRGLTKRYGDVVAVDDLSFDVEQGLVTGFLGPNGAGKSTTMRMVLGLDRPTSGTALVHGRPFASYAEPLREVGALLDPGSVHPGRTGRNHLRIAARTNGIGDRRVDEVIELVGLEGAARAPGQGLLARHAPAARHRRRAPRRPARGAVRRADQRARPRRGAVDPRAAAAAGRRGAHRAGLEPPDERDAADRRPARRHRSRAADRRRDDRRDPDRPRRAAGAGPHRRTSTRSTDGCGSAASSCAASTTTEAHVEGAAPPRSATSPTPGASRLHHLSDVEQSLEQAFLELTSDSVEFHGAGAEFPGGGGLMSARRPSSSPAPAAPSGPASGPSRARGGSSSSAAVAMVGLGLIAGNDAAGDVVPPSASRRGSRRRSRPCPPSSPCSRWRSPPSPRTTDRGHRADAAVDAAAYDALHRTGRSSSSGTATVLGMLLAVASGAAAFSMAADILELPLDEGLDVVGTAGIVFGAGLGAGRRPGVRCSGARPARSSRSSCWCCSCRWRCRSSPTSGCSTWRRCCPAPVRSSC